jgi:hypothetical protein
MSANILIESGISAGTKAWIDRPVLRIGSDPQCDVCLLSAELAPHALTLEFRDGSYRAYNRSQSPVNIGSTVVQPGANAVWQANDTLQLPGDLRLALEVDGDPRPAPRPESQYDDGFDDEVASLPMGAAATGTEAEAAAKKSKSSMIQMAIIGICVLAMAGLLMMKNSSGKSDSAAAADRPTFNQIVQESLTKDESHRAIVRRLQYAQAALVRNNPKLAHERFSELRDQLFHHVEALPADKKADSEQILSYVEYQLGRL